MGFLPLSHGARYRCRDENYSRIFWGPRHIDNFSGGSCGIKASRVVYSCLMTQSAAHAQSTNSVLMIRPARFYPNPETATDNAFQRNAEHGSGALTLVARNEFDAAVQTLRAAGVNVHVFEDTAETEKSDAVFHNNWSFTQHH